MTRKNIFARLPCKPTMPARRPSRRSRRSRSPRRRRHSASSRTNRRGRRSPRRPYRATPAPQYPVPNEAFGTVTWEDNQYFAERWSAEDFVFIPDSGPNPGIPHKFSIGNRYVPVTWKKNVTQEERDTYIDRHIEYMPSWVQLYTYENLDANFWQFITNHNTPWLIETHSNQIYSAWDVIPPEARTAFGLPVDSELARVLRKRPFQLHSI